MNLTRKMITATLVLGLVPLCTLPAFAQDEKCAVPMADWQPRDAVRKLAESKGWIVSRIKVDDGCYEVYAADAQGVEFEALVHPGTLTVLKTEARHKEHHDDKKKDDHNDRDDHD